MNTQRARETTAGATPPKVQKSKVPCHSTLTAQSPAQCFDFPPFSAPTFLSSFPLQLTLLLLHFPQAVAASHFKFSTTIRIASLYSSPILSIITAEEDARVAYRYCLFILINSSIYLSPPPPTKSDEPRPPPAKTPRHHIELLSRPISCPTTKQSCVVFLRARRAKSRGLVFRESGLERTDLPW